MAARSLFLSLQTERPLFAAAITCPTLDMMFGEHMLISAAPLLAASCLFELLSQLLNGLTAAFLLLSRTSSAWSIGATALSPLQRPCATRFLP